MSVQELSAAEVADTSAEVLAAQWLEAFSRALTSESRTALEVLFEPAAGWRDLVAFTWNLRQSHDRVAIVDLLLGLNPEIKAKGFLVDESRPRPSVISAAGEPELIELFFTFETAAGEADGYAVLSADEDVPARLRAHTLLTRLVSLHAGPAVWPPTGRLDAENPGIRWNRHLAERSEYADHEPEALIVGGGQFGVMTAANLGRLGVDALIVDRQPRVGDAWRSRYESLFLHQPHNILHFSMMRFPECFPEYLPKDKMAQWFESYVESFDLNFWTSTEFIGATYDEAAGVWEATLRRGDGSERVLRPKHLLMATGGSNIPNIPELPGIESFGGETIHAGEYTDGSDYAGRKVLVIGCGTSAHDFALDVVVGGGSATLVQRGPQIVIDLPTANLLYGDYLNREVPTELVDTRFLSGAVYHQQYQGFVGFQKLADDADRDLHKGLTKAGMKVWNGADGTGFYYSYLSKAKGGYYINVGASDAIVRGDIKVIQREDIETFDADGIVRADGGHEDYDVVVFATAYRSITESIELAFGSEFTEKLGPVWGFDTDGEMRNVLKPTAHEGFWILDGSIPMARWHSPLMALLIKAELMGLVPAAFKHPAHPSRTPASPVPALQAAFRARESF